MAHFKRGRSKHERSGCLRCKPHKANGLGLRRRVKGSVLRQLDRTDAMFDEHQRGWSVTTGRPSTGSGRTDGGKTTDQGG